MDTTQVIILVVVVLIVLALLAFLLKRMKQQKHQKRLALAEEHRTGAREELRDLQHQRADAEAAEARAKAAAAEAEKAELAAREAREAEQAQHARAEDKIREADRLDPRVDHKSKDYDPRYDRVTPGQQGGASHETGQPGTTPVAEPRTTSTDQPGTTPVADPGTHPGQGGEHRA
jgi:FtsZ-interacting cell division protein ZipA